MLNMDSLKPSKFGTHWCDLSRPQSSFNIRTWGLVTALYRPIKRDLSSGFSTFWFLDELEQAVDNHGDFLFFNQISMASYLREMNTNAERWSRSRSPKPKGKGKANIIRREYGTLCFFLYFFCLCCCLCLSFCFYFFILFCFGFVFALVC